MRIGFCGHPYHARTASSAFLVEALRELGQVEEVRAPEGTLDLTPFLEGAFDAVVVWQLEPVALRLAEAGLPNVTFFPMYDSCHACPDSFWRRLAPLKVVSFSGALHAQLQRIGVRVRQARFYPEVTDERVPELPALAGFFWQRQQDITWRTIAPLVETVPFERFTLHDALDPSSGALVTPAPEEAGRLHVRTTSWFASRSEARADLLTHNVYFAPRLREGIGLSFLEAMALGFLVVAPDRPTMSEYIVSGVNGLLYDPAHPAPLSLAGHREMGRRARESIAAGRERWLRSLPALLDLVATPTRRVPLRAAPRSTVPGRPAPSSVEVVRLDAPTGDALNRALDAAAGAYLVFLGPEDLPPDADDLRSACRDAPPGTDLIVGDCVERDELGGEEVRRCADPSRAYAALRRGVLAPEWVESLPARAAVLWRTAFLRRLRFTADAGTLASEEAMLRALADAARVHHSLSTLAVSRARRPSRRERLRDVDLWRRLARLHTDDPAALDRSFGSIRERARSPDLHRIRWTELLLSLPRRAGALREVKRRLRRRRALTRSARGTDLPPPREPDDRARETATPPPRPAPAPASGGAPAR